MRAARLSIGVAAAAAILFSPGILALQRRIDRDARALESLAREADE